MKRWLLVTTFAVAFVPSGFAQAGKLAGQVTSAEEGAMEGVMVSAKKDGSTIAIFRRQRRQRQLLVPGRET